MSRDKRSYRSTQRTRRGAVTTFGSRTDVGCVRDHNEDSLVVAPPLFAVADGMGGHAAGEVASEIAVNVLAELAPKDLDGAALEHAVEEANHEIIRAARDGRGREGMGTTLTACMLENERLVIAQVGDSRAYLLHHGKLQQLTRDHSLMADMIEAGQLTPEEARHHPQRSVITRALGSDPNTRPDMYEINVETGDRLLVCSDGLSSMIEDEQIEAVMSTLGSGEQIWNSACTEPGAGSDASSMVTTAVKDGDDYILNGRKCFISGAPLADYCIVYAKTDMSRGNKGISAFIVGMKAPGVSCGKHEAKMGLVGYATSDVVLEDVRVHKSDMLGKENMGFINAMKTLDGGRLGVSAQSIGLAQGCLDEAIKYSKERVQFGKPICKNQAIAFMLADMATKLTAAKELVYMAAQMKDRNDPNASMYCSMAKYFASETCNEIAAKAVQIHGGYGYIKEYPVERKYRDCRVFTIYEGTSQVQQMVISGNLLK